MPRPKRSSSENSKERILKGAARAFADKGYYGTTTRTISSYCGLEQPSIYHHFGNKENLFRETLFATHHQSTEYIKNNIVIDKGLKQELFSIVSALDAYQQDNPEHLLLTFTLIYTAPEDIREEYAREYAGALGDIIKNAFKRHPHIPNSKERLTTVVDVIQSFVLALTSREFSQRSDGDTTRWLKRVKRSITFILEAKM